MSKNDILTQLTEIISTSSAKEFSTFVTKFCLQIEADNVDLRTLGHQKRLHSFAHVAGFDNWHQLKTILTENEFKTHLRLNYYLPMDTTHEAWREVKEGLLKERTPDGYSAAEQYCQEKSIAKPDPQAMGRAQRGPMYFKDSNEIVYTVWENSNSNYHLPVDEIVDAGKVLGQSAKWVVFNNPATQQHQRFVLFDSADDALRCPTTPPLSYGVGKSPNFEKGTVIESGLRRSNKKTKSFAALSMEAQLQHDSKDKAIACLEHIIGHSLNHPELLNKLNTVLDMVDDSDKTKAIRSLDNVDLKVQHIIMNDLLPELLTTLKVSRSEFDKYVAECEQLYAMQKILSKRGHICTVNRDFKIQFHEPTDMIARQEINDALESEEDDTTDLSDLINNHGFDIIIDNHNVLYITLRID